MSPLLLLQSAVLPWCLGLVVAGFLGRRANHHLLSLLLIAGSAVLLGAAAVGLNSDYGWQAPPPVYLAVAPLYIRLDALSAVFLGLLAAIGTACSFFSPGYLEHLKERIDPGVYWVCFFLFMLSMAGVVLAANALTFLVFWELMSLSSVALVVCDQSNNRAPRAALIYLGATRIATGLIAGGFLWLYALTGSWLFSDWHLSSPAFLSPTLLLFFGFCIKAGIWPFHLWLPYAHPAAPSPVSALMSGVMVKIAIYAMIRLLVFGSANFSDLAYLALFLGIVSAFWGVLFALTQHDLKRLLAYHTIENVGLVLIGLAACLVCRQAAYPQLAALGLAAAIFHCINHGLFKSLLFLGAGAVDAGTGTRDLEHLGGLARRMPWTFANFLLGCAAISSLPPLNGFASKWLIYQSLFGLSWQSPSPVVRAVCIASMGVLALVGGLALACFTKALAVTFLGRARSHSVEHAHEGSPGMLTAQTMLSFACVLLGLAVPAVMRLLDPLCKIAVLPAEVTIAGSFTIPQPAIALSLIGAFLLGYYVVLRGRYPQLKRYITWECGYGDLPVRAQVTASSFAQPIEHIFSPLLQYRMMLKITGKDRRHFPERVKVEETLVSLLESRIYGPAVGLIEWVSQRLARIQAGSIHLYLLYMLITLMLLLTMGVRL